MMRRTDLTGSERSGTAPGMGKPGGKGKTDNRGVALVITLLLLLLMSILGLAAVLATSSDSLINGYYGNYRGSFYAADSGLNIARQSMQTYVASLVPNGTTWNTAWTDCSGTNQPITTLAWSNPYSSSTSLTGSSATTPAAVQNSWHESFKITNTVINGTTQSFLTFSPCTAGTGDTSVTYSFNYSMTSVGSASGSEQATITENGTFTFVIGTQGNQAPVDTSFSAFGAYIGNFPACDGSSLASGTISGPVYANGEWNLGSTGTYTFTDPVNQTGPAFSFYDGKTCYNSATVPYTDKNGTKFNPTFEAGFNLNQPAITVPSNSYSQMWAVLDGLGCGENNGSVCGSVPPTLPTAPTAQQMDQYNLQNADQHNAAASPYATESGSTYTPATSGVYLPYTCSGSTCSLSSTAGGIYVEDTSGAATTLTLEAATSSTFSGSTFPTSSQCTAAACQVIQVSQAGSSTTGSATVSAGTTSCSNGTCTSTYTKTTPTTTPSTITQITIDPTTNITTSQTYVQTVTSTLTQTATSSCSGSSCTPSAPNSNSYNSGSTTSSTSNGSSTDLTLTGVPTLSPTLATPSNSSCTTAASGACAETMVYVDGPVSITGPSSGAAVQNNSMLTVTANGSITQTGNLLYATEPVVTTSGSSLDSLVSLPASASYQVLGLYSSNGELVLTPPSGTNTLETDASIAVISSSSSCTTNCGMLATGSSFKTWTNVGGRAENSINTVNFSTGNVYFDQRFKQWTFAPPWFPQTSISQSDLKQTQTTSQTYSVQRVQWYSASGGQ